MPQWIQIFSALLTPVIAITVAVIGYLQWRTNQNKLKLDLFEKRYAIYEGIKDFISAVVQNGSAESDDLLKFIRSKQDALFLFKDDKVQYLQKMQKLGTELHVLEMELKEPGAQERQKKIERKYELLRWFGDQFENAAMLFSSDLKLNH